MFHQRRTRDARGVFNQAKAWRQPVDDVRLDHHHLRDIRDGQGIADHIAQLGLLFAGHLHDRQQARACDRGRHIRAARVDTGAARRRRQAAIADIAAATHRGVVGHHTDHGVDVDRHWHVDLSLADRCWQRHGGREVKSDGQAIGHVARGDHIRNHAVRAIEAAIQAQAGWQLFDQLQDAHGGRFTAVLNGQQILVGATQNQRCRPGFGQR